MARQRDVVVPLFSKAKKNFKDSLPYCYGLCLLVLLYVEFCLGEDWKVGKVWELWLK